MTNPWPKVREISRVLRPCWLAMLLVLLLAAALHQGQTLDALQEAGRSFRSSVYLSLTLGILGAASCAWYCSRALLYVRYSFTPDGSLVSETQAASLRCWTPRVLGEIPILSLAWAFQRAGETGHAVVYAVIAGLFLAFVVARRRWLGRGYGLNSALPRATFHVLALLLAISLLLLLAFLRSPVRFPQQVGPIAIVVYAMASWIAFGSVALVYPSLHLRIPSLVLVAIGVTAMFSLWNDNHAVRRGHDDPVPWHRKTVEEHLGHWVGHRQERWEQRFGHRPYPVFVVAAEGGGIRAAYWTASVLAHLEETAPGFACHLFAVSGVSGGSLGGAVFSALSAERHADPRYACDGRANPGGAELPERTRRIFRDDFLGPVLAGMLFSDLMQRFNPFPDRWFAGALTFPDRAEYLERAWETAWRRRIAGSDRFSANFRDLFREHSLEVPSLLLNGTWVETGGRAVTSNLRLTSPEFVEVGDVVETLDRPIRLSTAVHMSARFTYVSPAARMPDGRRIVDGGYFENSGALTAAEVLAVLDEARATHNIAPYALIITNSVVEPAERSSTGFLSETLAPIFTLFRARNARGRQAESFLAAREGAIRFRLDVTAEAPLGWMLSTETRDAMDEQVERPTAGAETIRSLVVP